MNEPNPLSDRIHIEQIEISARIGVPEKERSTSAAIDGQHFFLAISRAGGVADWIDNTVNYSTVAEETKKFVRDQLLKPIADRFHLRSTSTRGPSRQDKRYTGRPARKESLYVRTVQSALHYEFEKLLRFDRSRKFKRCFGTKTEPLRPMPT